MSWNVVAGGGDGLIDDIVGGTLGEMERRVGELGDYEWELIWNGRRMEVSVWGMRGGELYTEIQS